MQEYKRQVLIVDDEFRIGMLIKKLVHWEEFGLECLSVTDDPQHALELIRERKPDIVITDIRMPRITGLDLVRMAREGNEEIKFIIVSGYKDFEYAHKALQYEVDGYLLKPINEDELNELLRKVTGKIDSSVGGIFRCLAGQRICSRSSSRWADSMPAFRCASRSTTMVSRNPPPSSAICDSRESASSRYPLYRQA